MSLIIFSYMFQSNKKFSNIKNFNNQNKSSYQKSAYSEPPPLSEKVNNPYVPYQDYNYMNIIEAGTLNSTYGLKPSNVFPIKPQWHSTAEKQQEAQEFVPFQKHYLNEHFVQFQEPKLAEFKEYQEDVNLKEIEFEANYEEEYYPWQ